MKDILVIFFNEDYSENIPILERIYGSRFPNRLYIVPDHCGRYEKDYRLGGTNYRTANRRDRIFCKARRLLGRRNRHEIKGYKGKPHIVRVTGFKYYFQDYFWQARKALHEQQADWYWFVADDLLLNPNIAADNILEFFSLSNTSNRSIICKPYYRSDEWVNWFQSDYEKTVDGLRNTGFYAVESCDQEFQGDPHKTGPNQWRVIAGCADFFGCHCSILDRALEGFHALALRKMFVEIAIPNVLLSLDRNARTTKEYQWEFDAGRGNTDRIRSYLNAPMKQAFYHPVKLGILPPEFVEKVILEGVVQ